MTNGWIKIYADGTQVTGYDNDPNTSWTRTKLEGIVEVRLVHNNQSYSLKLDHPTEFWQSDDFEATMGTAHPIMIRRRIEMKDSIWDFNDMGLQEPRTIWHVLELDLRSNVVTEYFSDERI